MVLKKGQRLEAIHERAIKGFTRAKKEMIMSEYKLRYSQLVKRREHLQLETQFTHVVGNLYSTAITCCRMNSLPLINLLFQTS